MDKKNNRLPNPKSKYKLEKKHALWLQSIRQAKKNKGTNVFYESNQEIVKEFGLPTNIFDCTEYKDYVSHCYEICNLLSKGQKLNKSQKKNLAMLKKLKTNENINKIITEYGCEEYFLSYEEKNNIMCHKVCQKLKNNEKLTENMICWIKQMSYAKAGKTRSVFYESTQKIANEYGIQYMFNLVNIHKKLKITKMLNKAK